MISLILPVHNEEGNLHRNFPVIYQALSRIGRFEIIIAEDGSTDGTLDVARKYARMKGVRVITATDRSGKGMAIRRGINAARGSVIGFIDIDLAVPVKYLKQAVESVNGGNAFVIGNRYSNKYHAKRSMKRLAESALYNLFVRMLFNSKVKDHQCGFKFWSRNFIKTEIDEVKDNRWFFDTELIIRASRKGIKIYEIPVEWSEGSKSNVSSFDATYFIRAAIKMRMED